VFDLGFVRFRSGDWGLRVFFVLFSVYWSKLLGGEGSFGVVSAVLIQLGLVFVLWFGLGGGFF